jgi:hypothetical protein
MTSRLFDAYDFQLSLSAINQYIADISRNLDNKTRNKLLRGAFREGMRTFLQEERKELSGVALSNGRLNKYGTAHSGLLKSGLRSRIKIKNDRLSVIVGVRNTKKSETVFSGRKRKIRAPTYGGIWLNFGTSDHYTGRLSSSRSRIHNGSKVKGIKGNDWVMKSYNTVEEQIMNRIKQDIISAYNESVRMNYNSR